MFELGYASGKSRCGNYRCKTRKTQSGLIPVDTPIVRANLGTGRYPKTYCRTCLMLEHGCALRTLVLNDTFDWKGAYNVLMDYWNYIPDGVKPEVDEKLKRCGL